MNICPRCGSTNIQDLHNGSWHCRECCTIFSKREAIDASDMEELNAIKALSNKEYRKIMEQYCDKHCWGNCNYYGMIHCWDYSNGQHREWDERCPLLVKKALELRNGRLTQCVPVENKELEKVIK